MKIEKINYYNSLPVQSKLKKTFYRNEESEDAITFSSELNKDDSPHQNQTKEDSNKDKDKNNNNNYQPVNDFFLNMNENNLEKIEKKDEKLNIII